MSFRNKIWLFYAAIVYTSLELTSIRLDGCVEKPALNDKSGKLSYNKLMTMVADPTSPTEQHRRPWQWLIDQLDLAAYRPVADPRVVAEQVVEADSSYFVLKNPQTTTYLKLNEADYYVWQLMTGRRTVKELVVAYFLKYKSFAYGRVAALVQELKQASLLKDKPVGIFRQVSARLEARDWRHRWRQVGRAFVDRRFPVNGLDGYISAVYRWGGRAFFNPVAQGFLWLVAVAGALPFFKLLQTPAQFPVFGGAQFGAASGLALLLAAYLLVVFIHELAHALTTKHYGREIHTGGLMIYFGMPAFYVDTMDIWLEPKRHRVAVSWAGPFSGLALGGAGSLLAMFMPNPLFRLFCFKVAFWGYLGFLVNMNPLLELDGYFILMDALDIPGLRRRAFGFIKRELPHKLQTLLPRGETAPATPPADEPLFSREEILFTIFGFLSALYTLYVVWLTLFMWQERVVGALARLWLSGGWPGRGAVVSATIAVTVVVGLAAGATLWRWGNIVWTWLQRHNFFDREQNIVLLLILGVALLVGVSQGLPANHPLLQAMWLLSIGVAAVWSIVAVLKQYAGSEIRPKFMGLLGAVGLLLPAAVAVAAGNRPAALFFSRLAPLPLIITAFAGLIDVDLRRSRRSAQGAMVGILLLGFGGAAMVIRRSPSDVAALLNGGSVFAMTLFGVGFVPLVSAYRKTKFAVPWGVWGLAATSLLGFNLAAEAVSPVAGRLIFVFTFSLWALGGVAYVAAGRRLRFAAAHRAIEATLTAEERLRLAFAHFFEALFDGFRQAFGHLYARAIDDDLDVLSVTADWGVQIDRGRVRDRLDLQKLAILDQAARYQEVLSQTIDLMDNWAGSRFIMRAAQAAYDSLPWPEREVLGRYVLANTGWGGEIAGQFAAIRTAQFRLLRQLPLFAGASAQMLDRILTVARRQSVSADTVLLKQGKPFSYFALIISGEIEAWRADVGAGRSALVGELRRGAAFGREIFHAGPLTGAPVSYRASVPTELLLVEAKMIPALVESGFSLGDAAVMLSASAQMLLEMPLFAEFSPQQIEALLTRMVQKTVSKGEAIIEQGQTRRYFFVIQSGQVGVLARTSDGSRKMVAKLGQGEHFGETALFINRPYAATVVALTEVRLLTLDEFTFDRLVATSHHIAHYIEQVSSGRLQDTRRKIGSKQ